jgi:hypothetical protein
MATRTPNKVEVGNATIGSGVVINPPKAAAGWHNGVIIVENAIRKDGAAIAVTQQNLMRSGLDLGNAKFTDAAVRVGNGQIIRLDSPGQANPVQIKSDENGYLVVISGSSGVVFRSNDDQRNLLALKNDGQVEITSGSILLRSESGRLFKLVVNNRGEISLSPN